MSRDPFRVFALSYASKDAAEADLDALDRLYRDLYDDLELMDAYDAALLTRGSDSNEVTRLHRRTGHSDGWGAGVGLALGAACALFPAVTLGNGAVASTVAGGAIAVLAGHFCSGVSRDTLRVLGETLDEGGHGLLIVVASDMAAHVNDEAANAVALRERPLQADFKALRKVLQRIGEST